MVKDDDESLDQQWMDEAVECERRLRESVGKVVELVRNPLVQALKREAESLYRMRREVLELYWLSYDEDLFDLAGELAEFIGMAESLERFLDGERRC